MDASDEIGSVLFFRPDDADSTVLPTFDVRLSGNRKENQNTLRT